MAATEEIDSTPRKLADLRVVDLRLELEKRGLDKGGVKASLVERLTKALHDEGHDPEEYLFEVSAEGTPTKKTVVKRSNRKLNDNDSNIDSQEDALDDLERGDSEDEKNNLEADDGPEDALQLSVGDEEKLNEEEENADSRGKDDTQSDIDGDDPSLGKKEDKPVEEGGDKGVEKSSSKSNKTADASEGMSADADYEESNETTKKQAEGKTGSTEANKESDAGEGQHKSTEEEKSKNEEGDAGGKSSSETPAVSTTTSTSTIKSKSATTKGVKGLSKDEKGDKSKREPQSSRNLWVSGLAPGTRASELKTLFSKQGKVVGAKIVTNARTPGARCYGFVTMATSEEAAKCIQHLHRTELNGRTISVERTRHEPGGMLRRTEKSALAAKRIAQKRETIKTTVKTSETPKSSRDAAKTKDAEGEKAEEQGEGAKEENEQEKEAEKEGKEGKEKEPSQERSKERERGKEGRSSSRARDYRRPFARRDSRPFFMRGRGRGMRSYRERQTFRKAFFAKRPFPSKPPFKPPFKPSISTFQKIKEERRRRLREREIREVERRRAQEIFRQRSIERKQREESIRLERERERLRIEREKLERERAEVLRLEREKQRLERERLEREREELRRREQIRMDEPRRALKRPFRGGPRDNDPYWEERKRASMSGRYHEYENRERAYDRHDMFDRRAGERYEGRDKTLEVPSREFGEVRRDVRRDQNAHEREDRRVGERPERYNRNAARESEARGRDREMRETGRAPPTRERERMGPPRGSPPVRGRPPPRDEWKAQAHERRVHERYIDSGKVMSGPGGSFGSSGRSYGGERGESWGGSGEKSMGKSYGGGVIGSGSQWGSADSRKLDSSHGQSWGRVDPSQGNRWSTMDSRNSRQQGMGMGQSQAGMYGGTSQQMGGMPSHSSLSSSGYGSDRYLTGMRRY